LESQLEDFIGADPTLLGDRLSNRRLHADVIAHELGVSDAGFASNYRTIANAMFDGATPDMVALASQVASSVRSRFKKWKLSPQAHDHLSDVLRTLEPVVGSSTSSKPAARSSTAPPTLDSPRRGERGTLRGRVDDAIRQRITALIGAINSEANLDPDDYARVASSTSPLDALAAMVLLERPSRTFSDLGRLGRLDLSLEALRRVGKRPPFAARPRRRSTWQARLIPRRGGRLVMALTELENCNV
jgi:hypothetical protein